MRRGGPALLRARSCGECRDQRAERETDRRRHEHRDGIKHEARSPEGRQRAKPAHRAQRPRQRGEGGAAEKARAGRGFVPDQDEARHRPSRGKDRHAGRDRDGPDVDKRPRGELRVDEGHPCRAQHGSPCDGAEQRGARQDRAEGPPVVAPEIARVVIEHPKRDPRRSRMGGRDGHDRQAGQKDQPVQHEKLARLPPDRDAQQAQAGRRRLGLHPRPLPCPDAGQEGHGHAASPWSSDRSVAGSNRCAWLMSANSSTVSPSPPG